MRATHSARSFPKDRKQPLGDMTMNKFLTTLLGVLVGTAMFVLVGVGMAHAESDNGSGVVLECRIDH
jgi:hypothetical protein